MRRRTDLWSEPLGAPRTARPRGYNLDLAAGTDVANLKRLLGAGPEPALAAIASNDGLTTAVGRAVQLHFVTALRRLPASFAQSPTGAGRARGRAIEVQRISAT